MLRVLEMDSKERLAATETALTLACQPGLFDIDPTDANKFVAMILGTP